MDRAELSLVEEVTRSEGYRIIRERMQKVHADKMKELRNENLTAEQTQLVRGFLNGLDRALAVPTQLIDERRKRRGDE